VTVRRKSISILSLLIVAAAGAYSAYPQSAQAPAGPTPGQTTPQTTPQSSPQAPQQAPPISTQLPSQQPVTQRLAVVVLDPAHGGADQGARGSWGIAESDVVLSFARLVRISLEAQGLRVILTRQANEDPSLDDRSKLANAQRRVIFVTLHVSSTGQPGTVRVYSLPQAAATAVSSRAGLVPWEHAQSGFVDMSRKLAELIQIQMAQNFRGSSETPFAAAVRQLRTVAAPAVAVEVSSVSLQDRGPLDQMGPALADGVARAVAAFRVVYESEGK
jgi:N-acetylmuramoyl-L-alanine amidase